VFLIKLNITSLILILFTHRSSLFLHPVIYKIAWILNILISVYNQVSCWRLSIIPLLIDCCVVRHISILMWLIISTIHHITNKMFIQHSWGRQDSAISIAIGYRTDGWVVKIRAPIGARFLSSSHGTHRLWGPSSLLSNAYEGIFRFFPSLPLQLMYYLNRKKY
jgi:hypothetical protein